MSNVSAPAYTNGVWLILRLVWRRGPDRWPCCPSLFNLSTSQRAWPDDSGWRDNLLCATLAWDLVWSSSGLNQLAQTMKKREFHRGSIDSPTQSKLLNWDVHNHTLPPLHDKQPQISAAVVRLQEWSSCCGKRMKGQGDPRRCIYFISN